LRSSSPETYSDVESRQSRVKMTKLLGQWLDGEIDTGKFKARFSKVVKAGDLCIHVEYYVETRLLDNTCHAAKDLTPQQREAADRVRLFLASGAEYRWPKVPSSVLDWLGAIGLFVSVWAFLTSLLAVVVLVVALVLGLVLGWWWFVKWTSVVIAGGVILGLGGLVTVAVANSAWNRRIEAVWRGQDGHGAFGLDFELFPFANAMQLREAESEGTQALAELAVKPASGIFSKDELKAFEEADKGIAEENAEQSRNQDLAEALRRDPSRCPNCGANDHRRAPQRPSESNWIVAARKCRRCGCVWRRPWGKAEGVMALVMGGAGLGLIAVVAGEIPGAIAKGRISALVILGVLALIAWGIWACAIREGWRVLHGQGKPGEVFEQGEPVESPRAVTQ